VVSFQRYRRPQDIVDAPPRSWGALPVGRVANDYLLPLPDDDAFWLGLSSKGNTQTVLACVMAETETGSALDALTGASTAKSARPSGLAGLRVPPTQSIEGIASAAGGWWPFARVASPSQGPSIRSIRIFAIPSREQRGGRRAAAGAITIAPLHAPTPHSDNERASDKSWKLEQSHSIHLLIVSPDDFFAGTGVRLAPFDQNASYRGWRLP
jgi:hypothetical protein